LKLPKLNLFFITTQAKIAWCITVLMASCFWLFSRYPALNEKLLGGSDNSLFSALSFDAWVNVSENDGIIWQILSVFLNWADNNLQGMVFGVFLGASILTLFNFIPLPRSKSLTINTLTGSLMGMGLGLCTNCATPVAQGMYKSGVPLSTSLSLLSSSPAFNIVVLIMLFNLLPMPIAIAKVLCSVVLVFMVIPLLVTLAKGRLKYQPNEQNNDEIIHSKAFFEALGDVVKRFFFNIVEIISKAVPLMLVAGLVSAMMVTWQPLSDLPRLMLSFLPLLLTALIGTFLTVPIAFDVIVAAAMMPLGWSPAFVTTLLFTLGSYSVYPMFILWKEVSRGIAISMFLATVGLGLLAGYGVDYFYKWQWMKKNDELRLQGYRDLHQGIQQNSRYQGIYRDIVSNLNKNRQKISPSVYQAYPESVYQFDSLTYQHIQQSHLLEDNLQYNNNFSEINHAPFQKKSITSIPLANQQCDGKLFTEMSATSMNIDFTYQEQSINQYLYETLFYALSGGVSTVDIDNDGWIDVLLPQLNGESKLYRNLGNWQFEDVSQQYFGDKILTDVLAFYPADINNDGWIDLLVIRRFLPLALLINTGKGKLLPTSLPYENKPELIYSTASFGDIDQDGLLDLYVGGYGHWHTPKKPAQSLLFYQHKDGWVNKSQKLPHHFYDLSALFTDIDQDNDVDLYIANDLNYPDLIYRNDHGSLVFENKSSSKGLLSSHNSMSIDSGDIHNDLILDLFITDDASSKTQYEHLKILKSGQQSLAGESRRKVDDIIQLAQALKQKSPTDCLQLKNQFMFFQCMDILRLEAKWLLQREGGQAQVNNQSCHFPSCIQSNNELPPIAVNKKPFAAIKTNNLLLAGKGLGHFKWQQGGYDATDWTWSGKFVDMNNDGWQDLLITNGMIDEQYYQSTISNLYYQNNTQGQLNDQSTKSGFNLNEPSKGLSLADLDNDGDVDVIVGASESQPYFYKNNSCKNNRISIGLHFKSGFNRRGVGAKVIVYAGDSQQIREMKSGGGFLTADHPRLYFGLGQQQHIDKLVVKWGDKSKVFLNLVVNKHYSVVLGKE